MPLPGMTWPVRHEVGSPLVLHPLWESKQDPYIIVCGVRAIGGAEWQTHTLRQKTVRGKCTSSYKNNVSMSVSHN